jgi:hypothetical protein
MEVCPDFVGVLPEVTNRMQQWLGTKQHRTLGLFLACDLLQHLKEKSEPAWPIFMDAVFKALTDKDPDVRIPALYAVNLAASIPSFSQAAPQAFTTVAKIVGAKEPKKREEKAKVARDNAVAALLALAKGQANMCPPGIKPWEMVVSKLPLMEDYEEAAKVHKIVADLVLAQHGGLLGAQNEHLGKILSALAEVYSVEYLCEKDTDEKIRSIFKMLPPELLLQHKDAFTEKQQKKIERMLASTAVAQLGG